MLARRPAVCFALVAASVALVPARAGAHVPPRRVVVLWLDHTTFSDWNRPELPNMRSLLREGALALVAARTKNESTRAAALELSARATFLAGARERFGPDDGDICVPGLECAVLRRGRHRPSRIGSSSVPGCGQAGLGDPTVRFDDRYPGRARARYDTLRQLLIQQLPESSVLIVDPGDTARAEQGFYDTLCMEGRNVEPPPEREAARDVVPWIRTAMRRADGLLGDIRRALRPDDIVMVLSATPTVARARQRILLGAVAIAGGGVQPGLLASPTTRRAGVVALVDLAPTILVRLGIPIPATTEGRAAVAEPRDGALRAVRGLENDFFPAARARRPLTRSMLLGGIVLTILGFLTVVAGRGRAARGRAARGRLPRGWRDVLAMGLTALAAAPMAMYVEGALPGDSTAAALAVVWGGAGALALLARAALGGERGLGAILLATAALPLVDLLLGQPLGFRSPLSFQIAVGGRYFGIGDEMLGVVVGSAIFGAALLLDRARAPARWAVPVVLAFAGTVWLLGSPWHGAKFGAALTAIPAFGVLGVRAAGRPFDRRALVGIAVAGILVTNLVVLADVLRAPEAQTHVARTVSGRVDAGAILRRKLEATWRITAFTAWSPALAVFAGAVGAFLWRRRATFDRAMWGRPNLRAALTAGGLGCLAAIAFNDGGTIAAALIALAGSAATFTVLLAPER